MRLADRLARRLGFVRAAVPSSRLSAFSGAQQTRLTADWTPYVQSPDQETRYVLSTLRARARQLVRDNSHASGFVNELASNVIGPDGILLQAKITTANGALAKSTNREIERGWLEWGMPETASADGFDSWPDLQRLFIKTIAVDGEIIVRKHRYFDNAFGFTLQIIDPDLLDETFNRPASTGVNEIRLGIEVNAWGRPVAYHLWNRHPGDAGTKRERVAVPADEIIHKFVRYRPNQVRGVSWFAPVLVDLKMLDGYEEAELVAARTSASKMGWIVNKSPEAMQAFDPNAYGNYQKTLEVEPGLVSELLPGQEFQTFDPNHPSQAFKEFTKAVLRSVARGLNMAYTTLTGDLEAVNYSSIRAGLLSERDHWRTLQRWMGVHIHRPIYREWMQMALLAGAVKVDSRLASNYYAVEWKPRGWKWVDPVNDLTAAALAIALGLDSRQRLAAEQGRDFEEIVEELQHELDVAESAGVDISGAGTAPTGGVPAPTAVPTDPAVALDAHALQRRRQIHAVRAALDLLERTAA